MLISTGLKDILPRIENISDYYGSYEYSTDSDSSNTANHAINNTAADTAKHSVNNTTSTNSAINTVYTSNPASSSQLKVSCWE
jgi:hypothetical protein